MSCIRTMCWPFLPGWPGRKPIPTRAGMPTMRAISAIPVANCSQYPDLFVSRKSLSARIPLPRPFSVL